MRHIVYIGRYNGIIGGIERYMQNSAELLRRNGFAVYCLYMENGGKAQEAFAGAFDQIAEFSPDHQLLKNADMVVIHNIIPPELIKKLPADKSFFFAHDHNIYCQRHHYYTPIGRINCHRKYNKLICKLCSLGRNAAPPLSEYRKLPALVLSDFMAENLRKNSFDKVIKLPPFIEVRRTEHTFMPDGVLRILFLGQLIRGKGADLMVKALAKLDLPFHCTIAGDGNDRAMLEKMVCKYKLSDRIKFSGFVSDMEQLWQNCDVCCFPIRWQEPFGLVGLESIAHGIPVVAFDLGGVREWLVDIKNGFAVPEMADMNTAFRLIYQNYDILLPKMREDCFRIAAEKFSEENFVSRFKNLAEELK